MVPFKLDPAFQNYIWGGTLLKEKYNKKTNTTLLAESWELAAHPDGMCHISSGTFSGSSFQEFVWKHPDQLGTKYQNYEEFPLLIKFIDAKEQLSVQVHPNDAFAKSVEHRQGKTEMWYILECKRGASLYIGFDHPISKKEFNERIVDGTILNVLHRVPVKKGDVFFIEAGTIHAIGAGIVLVEIQQNSNLTYRVYDYGRLGIDGKPRPLHVEKALQVTRLERAKERNLHENTIQQRNEFIGQQLVRCDKFSVDHVKINSAYIRKIDESSFLSVLCLDGEGTLQWKNSILSVQKGDSVFVPSSCDEILLSGNTEYLLTTL